MCQPCSRPFTVTGSHNQLTPVSLQCFSFRFFYGNRRKSGAQQGVYLVVRNLRSAGERVMTNVRPTNPTNGTGVTFLWEMLACGELVNTE